MGKKSATLRQHQEGAVRYYDLLERMSDDGVDEDLEMRLQIHQMELILTMEVMEITLTLFYGASLRLLVMHYRLYGYHYKMT